MNIALGILKSVGELAVASIIGLAVAYGIGCAGCAALSLVFRKRSGHAK